MTTATNEQKKEMIDKMLLMLQQLCHETIDNSPESESLGSPVDLLLTSQFLLSKLAKEDEFKKEAPYFIYESWQESMLNLAEFIKKEALTDVN